MSDTLSELLDAVAGAVRDRGPLPELEHQFDLESAYQFQHQLNARLSPSGPDGIKAGVTTAQSQKALGINHALLGSLYEGSKIDWRQDIHYQSGRLLESEIAVLVDTAGNPRALAPAIELVSIRFSRKQDMSATNLVACNLAADAYMIGDWLPWSEAMPKLSPLNMTLMRDDELLNQTNLVEALGQPADAVSWIWHEAQRRGFQPTGDTLLLTGACGKVVPADTGNYIADFGDLGKLSFELSRNKPG